MAIILIGFALLCILLLLVLYRNLPNKKVFYGFCGTLSIALGISYYSFHVPQSQPVHLDEAAISHITSQQQIFAGWYTEYKKHLDVIDYTWQQYQQLLKDYHNDNISLNTLNMRLGQLEQDALKEKATLDKLPSPNGLDDNNYGLAVTILQKTQEYASQQVITIKATKAASSPENNPKLSHEERSRSLQKIMLQNAPDALFTANETNMLRSNLTIPENS